MRDRSERGPVKRNEVHGKFSLIAGMLGLLTPMFLFQVPLPLRLTTAQKCAVGLHLIATMVTCTLVGERRLKLGLFVLPLVTFGISSLLCWWILSTKP